MSMERWIPVGLGRSVRPFEQSMDRYVRPPMFRRGGGPSWDMVPMDARWDTYNMSLQQMDQQMKDMMREMDHMFEDFMRIRPAASFGQWREDQALQNLVVSNPDGSRQFRLNIDLSHFKPEEINIRTRDNMLEVHAKHEEEGKGSQVYREYRRMFTIPPEVKPEALKSTLSAAGHLALEAPLARPAIEEPKDHVIPIRHEK